MNTRGIAIVSLLLAVAVILFHQTAQKAPSGEEASFTNSMNQQVAWKGRRAPDVTAELLNKETFSLSDHVGKKVVILNFFATWCGPCKAEMLELIRFAEKHKNDPLVFIGVDAYEPESTVQDFVLDQGVTYPLALDQAAIMDRGRVITQENMSTLRGMGLESYQVEFEPMDALPEYLRVTIRTPTAVKGEIPTEKLREFVQHVETAGKRVYECTLKRQTLEDSFFKILKDGNNIPMA